MSSKKRLSLAQQNNQGAAGMIRRLVASSLGPKGLSKIVTNDMGDVFFASDCAMMLEKANYKHPIAKMMLDLAKGTNARCGDGSGTAVLLACALIEDGFDLIEQGISPIIIVEAYEKARDESIDFLEDLRINAGKEFLFRAISTSLSSKIPLEETNHIASVINSAVEHVWRKGEHFDAEFIKTIAKEGGSVLESRVIEGIGIDTEVLSGRMPSSVRNARIAIVEELFDVRKTKFAAEVRINDVSSIGGLQRVENDMVTGMVRNVIDSGANVLLTHKGIEEPASSMLVDHNILAARRVGGVDLRRISKATGAKIVYSSSELSKEHLGFASLVEERAMGGAKWLFIDGCRDPRAVSVLIRAGSQRSADHLENMAKKAIKVAETLIKNPELVVGGGSIEFAIAKHLENFALKFSGREQLGVSAFAKLLLSIVDSLAKNCGMKPIDTIVKLTQSNGWINADARTIGSSLEDAPVEPLEMKRAIIGSATEIAIRVLRIGDIFTSKEVHPRKEREPDYP